MAAIEYKPLLRGYKDQATAEERAPLIAAFSYVLQDNTLTPSNIYTEVWNWFTKQPVEELNKPLLMTKPGLMPATFPQLLPQGHHFAPKYHPHVKGLHWTAFNPIATRWSISRNRRDSAQFMTDEQALIALKNDIFAYTNAIDLWRMFTVMLMFAEPDEIKKLGSTKTDNSDGVLAELCSLYFPSNGASNGFPSHQDNLSLEQTFYCEKDGQLKPCCKDDATKCEGKPYVVKNNRYKEAFECLRKCIKCNQITSTASTFAVYGNTKGLASTDYAKWIGMLEKIQDVVAEMKLTPTSKYNICTKADGTCSTECKTACADKGFNIGCCTGCKDNTKCCCCYNQNLPSVEDLALFIHPDDIKQIKRGYPALMNNHGLNVDAAGFGVGKVFELPVIKKGEPIIINRKTIGIHQVYTEFGTADYAERGITTQWVETNHHFVIYPFQCVTVKKAT